MHELVTKADLARALNNLTYRLTVRLGSMAGVGFPRWLYCSASTKTATPPCWDQATCDRTASECKSYDVATKLRCPLLCKVKMSLGSF